MATETKNLDGISTQQRIESISSDYNMHPPPPPPYYYDDDNDNHSHNHNNNGRNGKKRNNKYEPIPDIQILKHNKQKKPKHNLNKRHRDKKLKTKSITPPPQSTSAQSNVAGIFLNDISNAPTTITAARSASPPSNISNHKHKHKKHKKSKMTNDRPNSSKSNGKYTRNYSDSLNMNINGLNATRTDISPPLTSHIAEIEKKNLKSWHLHQDPDSTIYPTYSTQPQNIKKAHKLLGLDNDHKAFLQHNNTNSQNRSKRGNGNDNDHNVTMNKSNSDSIYSVESLVNEKEISRIQMMRTQRKKIQ